MTTYAFVNPVVAVILAALVLHEPLTIRSSIGTATDVIGVVLMLRLKPAIDLPGIAARPAPDEVSV